MPLDNLLGREGDLYCLSNTFRMPVYIRTDTQICTRIQVVLYNVTDCTVVTCMRADFYYIHFLRINKEWNRCTYTKVTLFSCGLMRPAISFLKSKNFQHFFEKKRSLLYPIGILYPHWGIYLNWYLYTCR